MTNILQKKSSNVTLVHKRVTACVEDFKPLPAVALRVMDLASDTEATAADLEPIIQGDIALVAAILKLANSAFFGLRRKVISLEHALLLLGKIEVQSLVFARIMFQTFTVRDEKQKTIMAKVLKHSLECALAAECIAAQLEEENAIYFLCGMLHDIGKMVIVQQFFEEIEDLEHYGQLLEEDDLKAEYDIFGCGHDSIAAHLLDRWMFPPQLIQMVLEHHHYDQIKDYERPSQIVMIADLLSRWLFLRDSDKIDDEWKTSYRSLLLTCGKNAKIIPDEKSLVLLEDIYQKRLEDRADLLEML